MKQGEIQQMLVATNRWRRNAQTLRASGWRGVVATRSELDLDDAELIAMPTAMLAWLVDS